MFDNLGISGIAAAVPVKVMKNLDFDLYFNKQDIKEIVDKIGVRERRFADEKTCSSDLCFAAADKMLNEMNIKNSLYAF